MTRGDWAKACECMITYYSNSSILKDEEVPSMVEATIASLIGSIPKESNLLETMEPNFFLKIATATQTTPDISQHMSVLLAHSMSLHRTKMNGELFQKLTDKDIIPFSDMDAVFLLLNLNLNFLVARVGAV